MNNNVIERLYTLVQGEVVLSFEELNKLYLELKEWEKDYNLDFELKAMAEMLDNSEINFDVNSEAIKHFYPFDLTALSIIFRDRDIKEDEQYLSYANEVLKYFTDIFAKIFSELSVYKIESRDMRATFKTSLECHNVYVKRSFYEVLVTDKHLNGIIVGDIHFVFDENVYDLKRSIWTGYCKYGVKLYIFDIDLALEESREEDSSRVWGFDYSLFDGEVNGRALDKIENALLQCHIPAFNVDRKLCIKLKIKWDFNSVAELVYRRFKDRYMSRKTNTISIYLHNSNRVIDFTKIFGDLCDLITSLEFELCEANHYTLYTNLSGLSSLSRVECINVTLMPILGNAVIINR